MAINAKDVDALHRYAEGVMRRAAHHAGAVRGIALALLGAVIWRGDTNSIRFREHSGEPANVLWFKIGGSPYAFAYNHETRRIELRQGTQNGPAMHVFSDETPVAEVEAVFRGL